MLIPQYTPFCSTEAVDALLITSEEYSSATHTGALTRSIQFEHRASSSVSMHSLVDITRFAALKLSGWPNAITKNDIEAIELCLDSICSVLERSQEPTEFQSPHHLAAGVSEVVAYWAHYDGRVRFVTLGVILNVCQCWFSLTRKLTEILTRNGCGDAVDAAPDDVTNGPQAVLT